MTAEVRLPEHLLAEADAPQLARFRDLLLKGRLRLRSDKGDWYVRADPCDDFLVVKALQNAAGALRADVGDTLRKGAHLTPEETSEMAKMFAEGYPWDFVPDSLQAFRLDLLRNVDPLPVVEHYLKVHPQTRMFALRTTERFHFRDVFWRLAIASDERQLRLIDMKAEDAFPGPTAATGIAYVFAAHLAVAPLTARPQPLAAVLETLGGIQLVVVSQGVWDRPQHMVSWPSGSGYLDLIGEGQQVYKTRHEKVGPDVGVTSLEASVAGANALIRHLNDPCLWMKEDGGLDTLERQIAWSSVDLGFNTVAELAREWTTSESLWTAFRALGIVAGFWGVGLDDLLTPDTIQKHAVGRFPKGFLRETAEDITENWKNELARMYKGLDEKDAIGLVREIRNLVHGTGVPSKPGSPKRRVRLDALKGTGQGGLVLLKDIASYWWASLLFSPSTNARSGSPPWPGA